MLIAERDENICRLPFSPHEMVEMKRRLEKLEKPEAEKRRAHGMTAPGKSAPANFAEASGETRKKVADAIGVSHETLRKAEAVVEAAEKPDAAARQEKGLTSWPALGIMSGT